MPGNSEMMHCELVVFNTPYCHLFLSSEEEEGEDGNGDLIKEDTKTETELSKSAYTECAAESEASASNHSNAGTARSKSGTAASSAVTKCEDTTQVNDGEIFVHFRRKVLAG